MGGRAAGCEPGAFGPAHQGSAGGSAATSYFETSDGEVRRVAHDQVSHHKMTHSRFLPALPNVPRPAQLWRMKGAVFVLTLLLSPLANAQRATSSDWFPLDVGSTWSYRSLEGATFDRHVLADPSGIPDRVVVEDELKGPDGTPLDSRRYVVRVRESTGMWFTLQRDHPSDRLSPCPIPRRVLKTASCQGEESRRKALEGDGPVIVGTSVLDRETLTYVSETGFGVTVYARGIGPVLFTEENTTYVLESAEQGVPPVQGTVGLSNALVAQGVSVWPTPTRGPVTLRYSTDTTGPLFADVLDALGRKIMDVALPPGPGTQAVHLDLPSGTGVVIVRVRSETETIGTARTVRVR